jgi:hypothetical protein
MLTNFLRVLLALAVTLFVATAAWAAPQIDPETLPDPVLGQPYSENLTFTSAPGPVNGWSSTGALPPGLTLANQLSTTTTLSGTPTVPGTYTFTVTGESMNGMMPYTRSRTYTLTVAAPATPVPTLSEWALILFGTLLAGGAALYVQRRRIAG